MLKLKHSVPVIFMFAATSALADADCVFTMECLQDEACQETAFELSVTDGDSQQATLSSVNGDVPVEMAAFQTMSTYLGESSDTMHMLTQFEMSEARYTVHMMLAPQEILSITYIGTCTSK